MTVARTKHSSNTVLGNGEIFFDQQDADGNYTGERFLGDSVGATLSVTSERTTIQSGDGAIAQDLVDIVRSVSRTFGFTLRDSSIANWALFMIGDAADSIEARSADGSAVTDEALGAVKAGRTYVLGQGSATPFGVGSVKTVSVKAGTTGSESAVTAGDDKWQVDLATGRITFFADYASAKVTYTPAQGQAATKKATATPDARQITGALRYIEDEPAAGKGRSVYIRKCNLVPGGEAALKSRETEQQMAFTATVQDPGGASGYPAVAIDGEEL